MAQHRDWRGYCGIPVGLVIVASATLALASLVPRMQGNWIFLAARNLLLVASGELERV